MMLAYAPLLAVVLCFAVLFRELGRSLKAFSWFVFFSGAIQFTSLYLWYRSIHNLPLSHMYAAGGFVCLVRFYQVVLDGYIRAYVIWSIAVLFVVFCIINAIFWEPLNTFNSHAWVVLSILVVILSLFTFLFLLNHSVREAGIPDWSSISWINSGLFIYFLSCFILYYFGDVITISFTLSLRKVAWVFHSFFSIVMYSCFLIGLWKRSGTPV